MGQSTLWNSIRGMYRHFQDKIHKLKQSCMSRSNACMCTLSKNGCHWLFQACILFWVVNYNYYQFLKFKMNHSCSNSLRVYAHLAVCMVASLVPRHGSGRPRDEATWLLSSCRVWESCLVPHGIVNSIEVAGTPFSRWEVNIHILLLETPMHQNLWAYDHLVHVWC